MALAVKEMGLELLCEDERFASDTVTAVRAPEGVDVGKLRTLMEDEHDVVLAGGQGRRMGSIAVRIRSFEVVVAW